SCGRSCLFPRSSSGARTIRTARPTRRAPWRPTGAAARGRPAHAATSTVTPGWATGPKAVAGWPTSWDVDARPRQGTAPGDARGTRNCPRAVPINDNRGMVTKNPKGLGMGLEALLGPKIDDSQAAEGGASQPSTLKLTQLQAGKYQPRTRMDEGSLYELAE